MKALLAALLLAAADTPRRVAVFDVELWDTSGEAWRRGLVYILDNRLLGGADGSD